MAVSNSTDAKSTGVQILEDALSLLGVLAEEEQLQAHELQRGLRVMTKMLKAWEADGVGTWLYTEGTLALVGSDGTYTFGAGGDFTTVPFEITQIRYSHNGGQELELRPMSRAEYYRISDRTTASSPNSFFYDRQRDGGTLYVWMTPGDNDYDLTFTYRRRIMDMDAGADNFDLPPEWEEAITEGLAYRLIAPYGKAGSAIAKKLEKDSAISYAIVKAFDVAEGGGEVSILPDDYEYYR